MKNLIKILCAGALFALPFISFGHPGHGHESPLSPGHYLGNPVHSIPIALTVAAAAAFVVWKIRRARNDVKK
jgi:hypothetical protein